MAELYKRANIYAFDCQIPRIFSGRVSRPHSPSVDGLAWAGWPWLGTVARSCVAVGAVKRHCERDGRLGLNSSVVERELFLVDAELACRLDQQQTIVFCVGKVADRRRPQLHVDQLQPSTAVSAYWPLSATYYPTTNSNPNHKTNPISLNPDANRWRRQLWGTHRFPITYFSVHSEITQRLDSD